MAGAAQRIRAGEDPGVQQALGRDTREGSGAGVEHAKVGALPSDQTAQGQTAGSSTTSNCAVEKRRRGAVCLAGSRGHVALSAGKTLGIFKQTQLFAQAPRGVAVRANRPVGFELQVGG